MNMQIAPAKTQTSKEKINALHAEFLEYGRNAKHWLRQCQMLLPKIRDEEVWKRKGFNSIYEYAAKLAGMSHNSVNEALRVYDALLDKPILMDEVEKHGTHKVKTIITVATEKTQEFWVKKLNEMSKSTLETYVREYKKKGLPGEGQRTASQDGDMSNTRRPAGEVQTASIYMKLEVEVIEKLKQIKGDRDWNELMKDLLKSNKKPEMRSEDDNKIEKAQPESTIRESEEKPSPVNTGKRYVPKKIQKYVTNKTSGLCAYPGCTKPYEMLHHTKRFAIDGTHDPDTLKPLCKAHERLAHKGLIENEESQPVEFTAGGCGGEGELSDSGESGNGGRSGVVGGDVLEDKPKIQINWAVKKEADTNSLKYEVDKKVNEYYMPKLE